MPSECVCFFLPCFQVLLFYIKAEQESPKHFSKYFNKKALNICQLNYFLFNITCVFPCIQLHCSDSKAEQIQKTGSSQNILALQLKTFFFCQLNNFSGLYMWMFPVVNWVHLPTLQTSPSTAHWHLLDACFPPPAPYGKLMAVVMATAAPPPVSHWLIQTFHTQQILRSQSFSVSVSVYWCACICVHCSCVWTTVYMNMYTFAKARHQFPLAWPSRPLNRYSAVLCLGSNPMIPDWLFGGRRTTWPTSDKAHNTSQQGKWLQRLLSTY